MKLVETLAVLAMYTAIAFAILWAFATVPY